VTQHDFAKEFTEMLQTWHSHKEVYDDELLKEIYQQEIDLINNPIIKFPPWGTVYFSPSSASSSMLELYLKCLKYQRDEQDFIPFRERWKRLGTFSGSMVQQELVFIGKHYQRVTGKKPPFVFERTERGHFAYEGAVKKLSTHKHRGHDINLFGSPDGILIHTATGTRVGCEIKSKQTSPGSTGFYKMKEATPDHVEQTKAYSIQHDLSDYIIFYINLSKKSWNMSEEDLAKSPDIRAFNISISEEDKLSLLDYFADVLDAVKEKKKPSIDLSKWTFNNFKRATAETLTDEEFERDVKAVVKNVQKSNLPNHVKNEYLDAFMFIEEVRLENE
jgi:hypothetical protein